MAALCRPTVLSVRMWREVRLLSLLERRSVVRGHGHAAIMRPLDTVAVRSNPITTCAEPLSKPRVSQTLGSNSPA